jgi:Kef-type K+ transport system membrane component KefB
MYEPRGIAPLTPSRFAQRFALHFAAAQVLVVLSLAIGMTGYMYFEHLPWRDAFVNSAMLLGGMGPVDPLKTDGGKLFAGLYALYCGLVFLIVTGVLLAPVIHRILHRFHWEQSKPKS